MPIIIGGVLVLVVVLVIVLASRGKKEKPKPSGSTELTADSVVDKPDRPAKPKKSPPPKLPQDVIDMAKEIAANVGEKKARADALYEKAMEAKKSNDRETWTENLKEAETLLNDIKYQWNDEVIGTIERLRISNDDWDSEQIANHWLGKEGQKVTNALERLAYIKKQLGAN